MSFSNMKIAVLAASSVATLLVGCSKDEQNDIDNSDSSGNSVDIDNGSTGSGPGDCKMWVNGKCYDCKPGCGMCVNGNCMD